MTERTIKHKGFGKWAVLEGETIVRKGLTKPEALAIAGQVRPPDGDKAKPAEQPAVIHDPIPTDLTEAQRRRLYEKRLEQDIRAEQERKNAPFKALLLQEFDEDTANRLWMQIEPMLNAGKEGVRRNIGRNMRLNSSAERRVV